MKFGISLMENIEKMYTNSGLEEWTPHFINYALLKKKIKCFTESEKERGRKPSRMTSADELLHTQSEVEFFRLVESELKKGVRFFVIMEQQFNLRTQAMEESLRYTKFLLDNHSMGLDDGIMDEFRDELWVQLMRSVTRVYKEAILLRHWILMSYCGFSKILKKHDRWTGFLTRDKYMSKVLAHQPFMNCPKMTAMLSRLENLYNEIASNLNDLAVLRDFERHIAEVKQNTTQASHEFVQHAANLSASDPLNDLLPHYTNESAAGVVSAALPHSSSSSRTQDQSQDVKQSYSSSLLVPERVINSSGGGSSSSAYQCPEVSGVQESHERREDVSGSDVGGHLQQPLDTLAVAATERLKDASLMVETRSPVVRGRAVNHAAKEESIREASALPSRTEGNDRSAVEASPQQKKRHGSSMERPTGDKKSKRGEKEGGASGVTHE